MNGGYRAWPQPSLPPLSSGVASLSGLGQNNLKWLIRLVSEVQCPQTDHRHKPLVALGFPIYKMSRKGVGRIDSYLHSAFKIQRTLPLLNIDCVHWKSAAGPDTF